MTSLGRRPAARLALSDKVALVMSLAAIAVSIVTARYAYLQSEVARIASSRPQLMVDASIPGQVQSQKGEAAFNFDVEVQNYGHSAARNVQAIAKLIVTNSPQYAAAQFQKNPLCSRSTLGMAPNIYPNGKGDMVFTLSTQTREVDVNVRPSFEQDGVYYTNGALKPYVVGCVSYSMNGVADPFVESFIKAIDARCGPDKSECPLVDDKRADTTPVAIDLKDLF